MSNFNWSYSRLVDYETCARRYYHYRIAMTVKEEDTDELIEGRVLHKAFEDRIKRGVALPMGLGHHEKLLAGIIDAPGRTLAEQKLALTSSFTPTGYFASNAWFRTVVDATKMRDDGMALIFDWKTGKPKEDITQLELMAAAVFAHEPRLQRVRSALVFINYGKIERRDFVREDVTRIWAAMLPRVKRFQQAREKQEFPPNPSGLCKKYCLDTSCPFHGRGG